MLVLPDSLAAVAAELCQLASAEARQPGVTARVLRLVNTVLLHLERQRQLAQLHPGAPAAAAAAAAAPPPAALARLVAAARWLAALCVRCRWPALLRAVLPATTAGGAAPEAAVAGMDALLPAGLLGTAAAANSAALLQALGDWGVAAGHTWRLEDGRNGGMTALHLAAALGPTLSMEAASALLVVVGEGAATRCWRRARAHGWTPRLVADATSNHVLVSLMDPLAAVAAVGEGQQPSRELFSTSAASSSGGGVHKAAKPGRAAAAVADEEAALLQRQLHAVDLEMKAGEGGPAGRDGPAPGLPARMRIPATAAQLATWQRRPMHPALLAAVGAAAILIVVGLSAALRAGLYD